MLEVYGKDGTLKQIVEKEEVDLKLGKNAVTISELPLNYNDSSLFFYVGKDITIESVTIPVFSRGVLINNGASNDMVLLAVDPLKNLYIGFRNNLKWTSIRKI
ncbi:hypothetical protein KEC48_03985 [Clostridium sp. C1]|uniref:hypothetical protein n=1 Tax=Clostridium sp. C1 TaxID=1155388 RepID=UPI001BAD4EBC|nr:hypothetical protein [Clostridium sp. C1]QUN13697.1 hypothetical protein KEC48_03985 [Clostridium sp. C1]